MNLLLIILLLGGCSRWIISSTQIKLPKQGSKVLIKAYKDGCATAHSSRGNSLHRTFFSFQYDKNYVTDAEYRLGWTRGYIACFHVVNRAAHSKIDQNFAPEHGKWFWNRDGGHSDPKIDWFWNQGVDINFGGKLKMPGEGENTIDMIFNSCNAVWRGNCKK